MALKDFALKKIEEVKRKNELSKQQEILRSHEKSVNFKIASGPCALGPNGFLIMRQRTDDMIYLNDNQSTLYELIGFEWEGPIYGSISESSTVGSSHSTTNKNGKSGKMTVGAIIGTAIIPGAGTIVGAAIGAGGKSKSDTHSVNQSNTIQLNQTVEQVSPAIIKLRNVETGSINSVAVVCTSSLIAQLKCMKIKEIPSTAAVSKNTVDALNGIKALKELLDMGAITQEEFDDKKKQLLN